MPRYVVDFAADAACRADGIELDADDDQAAIAKACELFEHHRGELAADYENGFVNERIFQIQDESGGITAQDVYLEESDEPGVAGVPWRPSDLTGLYDVTPGEAADFLAAYAPALRKRMIAAGWDAIVALAAQLGFKQR